MADRNKEYIRGGSIHSSPTTLVIKTGGWRVFKPVLDPDKCTQCKMCFWVCPDACIRMTEDAIEIDYDYCKGCSLCAAECPKGAITVEREER